MQYSSPLISSKLWAELATYVRQLCKISDRAHTQNLTGVEMRDKNREEGTESEREHERGGRRAEVRGMRQECPIESRLLENAWPSLLTPYPEMHNVRRSRDYRKVNEFERICPLAHLRWFPKNSSTKIYIIVYITNSRHIEKMLFFWSALQCICPPTTIPPTRYLSDSWCLIPVLWLSTICIITEKTRTQRFPQGHPRPMQM